LCIKLYLQYSSLPCVPDPCPSHSFSWDRTFTAKSTGDAAHHISSTVFLYLVSLIHTFYSAPHSRTPPSMFLLQDGPPGFTPVHKRRMENLVHNGLLVYQMSWWMPSTSPTTVLIAATLTQRQT
jgi:hypothetical protein